jgi:acetolactate synthase-1/2/3 large subunit
LYPDAAALDQTAKLMAAAHYPVLLLGLQCQGATEADWLRALAESVPAPVLTTDQAKGVLPDSHPLVLGVLTGGVIDKAVISHADLVVAIGLDPTEFLPHAWPDQTQVIHLARTPYPRHYFAPAAEVIGEIRQIIEELAPRLRRKTQANWDLALVDRLKRGQV